MSPNMKPEEINVITTPSTPSLNESVTNSAKVSIVINEKKAETWHPQTANYEDLPERTYHSVEDSPYPLPADIKEQDRLEAQHLVVIHRFGRLYHMPIQDVLTKIGSRIIDVGCGAGSWTRDMAKEYPFCEVHCVVSLAIFSDYDIAKTLFNNVEVHPNIYFQEGNVLEGLPFPDNFFDGVFQRTLVFAIPTDKWGSAVNELVRVTKHGFYVECVEPLAIPQQLGPLINITAVFKAITLRNLDINICKNGHIRGIMENAKLSIVNEVAITIPIGWDGKAGELCMISTKMIIESLKPFLMSAFEVNSEEFDELNRQAIEEYPVYKTFWRTVSVTGQKV
ncbi:hypothetical protein HK096_001638 [Nowakowskiella sp. JEL0078]|nr:hypothetical protein HK096_001638 [Nowakowskiella sp. JEL0078]